MEKRYDVQIDGQIRWGLAEGDISRHFQAGAINRYTPCRVRGTVRWLSIDDCLPLLKYGTDVFRDRDEPKASSSAPCLPWKSGRLVLVSSVVLIAVIGACMLVMYQGRDTALVSTRAITRSDEWPVERLRSPQDAVHRFGSSSRSTFSNSAQHGITIQQPSSREQRYIAPAKPKAVVATTRQAVPPTENVYTAPKPPAPAEEYTYPLNIDNSVGTKYGAIRLRVVDHGPVTMSVWVNGTGPRRMDKVKGFDRDGTNLTPIHRFPGATVYYVDRVDVPLGNFVIKVVPDK